MSKREADPDDPMELVGIRLPVDDDSAIREMAECFAEEFVRLGHTPNDILGLFRNPFYGGPHEAYRVLGEETVCEMIDACWRVCQAFKDRRSPRPWGGINDVNCS